MYVCMYVCIQRVYNLFTCIYESDVIQGVYVRMYVCMYVCMYAYMQNISKPQ